MEILGVEQKEVTVWRNATNIIKWLGQLPSIFNFDIIYIYLKYEIKILYKNIIFPSFPFLAHL